MSNRTKLELTWIGKEQRPRLEPRILLEDQTRSYHAAHRKPNDHFDNRVIFGDNLLALKALEQEFTGKIKCICIDPPYNTGSAFTHYDDGIEHSLWLTMMRNRLDLLRCLLSEEGSIWIFVDDNEAHYLKVLCDEIFGRANFISNVIWQKKYAPANDAKWLSNSHDHILVYARDKLIWRPNKLPRASGSSSAYKNPDNDPRGEWRADNYTCSKSMEERPNLYYKIIQPNTGEEIFPSKTRVWAYSQTQHLINERQGLVWWGKDGTNSVPAYKRFLPETGEVRVAQTIWLWQEVGHTQDGRKEQINLIPDNPFATPKPEAVIQRIIQLGTQPGDWVLDSFAGSGTTGAVAHKMGRQFILIEQGEHCHTHILPRLHKVINGTDTGGITKSVDWKGGGGFRYQHLAPSLLQKDKWDNWIINPDYNPEMLAEALCKHEGFTYSPSETHFWQHGYSTETDFIYVTTQTLTLPQLQHLSSEVGDHRTLLVCCAAFLPKPDQFPNLTLKKIPNAVLGRCEWGRDDYSLAIASLPDVEPAAANGTDTRRLPRTQPTPNPAQESLSYE